ncbi:MAG TPA: hypothetical protein VMH23_09985 [Bacteroidota bacterium]|nr:hypothetical protein [Bacteroidota bacterium]
MTKLRTLSINTLVLNAVIVYAMVAQDYNLPLSMEGLNHTTNTSVLSKSLGGVTIPLRRDVSLMFANPASLGTLDALTISVGAAQTSTSAHQTQQWQPSTYFGNYSLLMDGSANNIVHTDTSTANKYKLPGNTTYYPGDTLWKAYDNIGPNWSHDRSASKFIPNIFAAMPVKVMDINATVGLGYSEYANMDYFYQNNNSENPNPNELMIGQGIVKGDSTRRIDWFQSIRRREGSISSLGGAVAINITPSLTAAVSVKYISGSTDDFEQTLGRGVIWFFWSGAANKNAPYQSLRLDSVSYMSALSGTSDYKGYETAISATYRGKDVTLGVTITLPTEIDRTFNGTSTSYTNKTMDFAAVPLSTVSVNTFQEMDLPIKGNIGIGLQLRSNVYAAAEYEYDPYGNAKLITNHTTTTKPWLDGSSFHFGLKWEPVADYSLRFGYRRQTEVFQAQYSPFPGQPVSYVAYSAGLGIQLLKGLAINAAYEFYQRKYEDTWVGNSNINFYQSGSMSVGLQYAY